MTVDNLLSRLDKVKPSRSKPRHWFARCPAHEDKSPSLAIREMDDGRILLKCFCGCPTSDVLAALGLEFSDLYPEPLPKSNYAPERRPWPASDVLRCIAYECFIVVAAVADLHERGWLPEADEQRLHLAAARIQQAASLALGESAHG